MNWFAALIFGLFSAEGSSADSNWPQWRGPSRDGFVSATGAEWPDTLDGLRQSWRVELGPGYPGPIIAEGKVFVAETQKEAEEVVCALDQQTGKEIWRHSWAGAIKVPFFAKENGDWIRSTPTYDEGFLYVGGMRDHLVCLDAKSGTRQWAIDFVKEFESDLPAFGFVSSPLVLGPHLYVQAGGCFCKIEKATGKVVWRTLKDKGGMMAGAFSSPIHHTLAGRDQFVVLTRTQLAGVDGETGDVLWTQDVPNFRGMNILTPVVFSGGVFTSSYNNKSYFYSLKSDGTKISSTLQWENKIKGYMSTPLLIDGHVYLHLQNQRAACLDLSTGKESWISSRRFGKYWSMVGRGKRMLALDQEGVLLLLEADPKEMKILSEKKVSDQETWAHLAIVGRDLFIRELHGISAWHWDDAGSPASTP